MIIIHYSRKKKKKKKSRKNFKSKVLRLYHADIIERRVIIELKRSNLEYRSPEKKNNWEYNRNNNPEKESVFSRGD